MYKLRTTKAKSKNVIIKGTNYLLPGFSSLNPSSRHLQPQFQSIKREEDPHAASGATYDTFLPSHASTPASGYRPRLQLTSSSPLEENLNIREEFTSAASSLASTPVSGYRPRLQLSSSSLDESLHSRDDFTSAGYKSAENNNKYLHKYNYSYPYSSPESGYHSPTSGLFETQYIISKPLSKDGYFDNFGLILLATNFYVWYFNKSRKSISKYPSLLNGLDHFRIYSKSELFYDFHFYVQLSTLLIVFNLPYLFIRSPCNTPLQTSSNSCLISAPLL